MPRRRRDRHPHSRRWRSGLLDWVACRGVVELVTRIPVAGASGFTSPAHPGHQPRRPRPEAARPRGHDPQHPQAPRPRQGTPPVQGQLLDAGRRAERGPQRPRALAARIMAQPQLCRSQLVTTFGPGCMIDLPETSVFAATLENGRYRDAESRKQLSMSEAGGHKALGFCNGRRPWLGANQREKCDLPARLLSAPWHGMSIAACSGIPVGQIAPPPGANRSTPWGKSPQCAWGNLPHPSSRGHLMACKKMPGSTTQTLSWKCFAASMQFSRPDLNQFSEAFGTPRAD